MQMARDKGKGSIFEDEREKLGGDSDRFLQAISRRSVRRKAEFAVYGGMGEILMQIVPDDRMDRHLAELAERLEATIENAV